jgi:hypothetical protein
MFQTIPIERNEIRKKLFCAFALPHFFGFSLIGAFLQKSKSRK